MSPTFMARWLVLVGLMFLALPVGTQTGPEIRVLKVPTIFTGSDGQLHLAYELSVRSSREIRIEGLDVFGDANDSPLLTYGPTDLDRRTMRPGATPEVRYNRSIPANGSAVIHVWLTIPTTQPAPTTLLHRLRLIGGDGTAVPVGDVPLTVEGPPVLVLGPPLRSGTWFAHNGPGNHRSPHWGSMLVENGRALIPQRYAIDFLGLDANGRLTRGDDITKTQNEDWLGFGAEVIAVADGSIREIRDGVVDNAPLVERPRPTAPTAALTYGNYVVLETSPGVFVHYVHLKRHSVVVKVAERVRRGQKLGLVGNSGNTNGAHLHFTVTNSLRFEESDGLPYVFAGFEMLGSTTAERAAGEDRSPPNFSPAPSRRREELPLDGAVVRFD